MLTKYVTCSTDLFLKCFCLAMIRGGVRRIPSWRIPPGQFPPNKSPPGEFPPVNSPPVSPPLVNPPHIFLNKFISQKNSVHRKHTFILQGASRRSLFKSKCKLCFDRALKQAKSVTSAFFSSYLLSP